MKRNLLVIAGVLFANLAIAQCNLNVTATVTPVSCLGNDGSITLSSNVKGLLISEYLANPASTDSSNEWVELYAVKDINFAQTPYTVIFLNNGNATTAGWTIGGNIGYAFQIDTGSVSAGDIIYVGGSAMNVGGGTIFRSINTAQVGGDGGMGNANSTGVLGNGGANADGIGVFDIPVSALTSSTVPVDAIFFGTGVGSAVVNGGADGYQLPVGNGHYSGGKLQSSSFIAPNPATNGTSTAATVGIFDLASNAFTLSRMWNNGASTPNSTLLLPVGTYSVSWSNGATTETISGLSPGTYISIVTAGIGCSDTDTVVVLAPVPFTITPNTSNPNCAGGNDGSVSIAVSGGAPGYTYLWNTGDTTSSIGALSAGTYIVIITDAAGCDTTVGYTLNDPAGMQSQASPTDATCEFDADGGVVITTLGGQTPYTYLWNPNVNNTASSTTLEAGNYTVIIVDANGCTDTVNFQVGFDFNAPPLNLGADQFVCAPNTVTLDAGAGFNAYDWSSGQTTQTIVVSASGTYSVEIEDANGCTNSDTVNIIVDPCAGLENNEINISVYPNPASDFITITADQPADMTANIYDMNGKLIMNTAVASEKPVSIANLEAGIYIVKIISADQTFTFRLTKI